MADETKSNKTKNNIKRFVLKPLVWIVSILLALTLIVLIFINPIAGFVIRHILPSVAGVPVSLESIRVSPLQGRAEIVNLVIGNPENAGYASPHALKLGEVNADIALFSIFRQKFVIEEITLRHIEVNLETNFISSNLGDIISNLQKLQPAEDKTKKQSAPAEAAPKEEKKAKPEKGLRLQVNQFAMEDVGIYVYTKGVDKAPGVGIPITIDPMTNVGTDPEGVSPVTFSIQVLTQILVSGTQNAGMAIGRSGNDAASAIISAGSSLFDNMLGSQDGKDQTESEK